MLFPLEPAQILGLILLGICLFLVILSLRNEIKYKKIFKSFRLKRAAKIRRIRKMTNKDLKDIVNFSIDMMQFIPRDIMIELERRRRLNK